MNTLFTPVINLHAVLVADFIGIAILLVILVTRGWNLPGRKAESRIMLRMLIASVFNCIIDQVVTYCDGRIGKGYAFFHSLLYVGNTYLYIYNVLVGVFLINMIVKHIDSEANLRHFIVFWIVVIMPTPSAPPAMRSQQDWMNSLLKANGSSSSA